MIGRTCKDGDVLSGPVLMARDLSFRESYAYEKKEAVFRIFSLKLYTAVAIATGNRLFPFRTEKLSPSSPMVLPDQVGE